MMTNGVTRDGFLSHPHTNDELSFVLTTIPCYKALDVTAIEIVKICIQVIVSRPFAYCKGGTS